LGLHEQSQQSERLELLVHCVSVTVDAVIDSTQPRSDAQRHAGRLALALGLDMRRYWQSTSESYLGRVSKSAIFEAVAEGA
jgi:ParB family chromosome partitioning protein